MIIDNQYIDIPGIARLCNKSAQWVRYRIHYDDNFPKNVMIDNHPTFRRKHKELYRLTEIHQYLDENIQRKPHTGTKRGQNKPKHEAAPRVKTFVSWVLGTEKRPVCKPITQPFTKHVRVVSFDD